MHPFRLRMPLTARTPGFRFGVAWLLSAAALVAAAAPALAVDKYAAEFLKIGVGARALGMGGAFVSLADDASATYWNPAGLVGLETREALGMHATQFDGVESHDVLGVASPLRRGGADAALGLTLIRLAVDDIKVTKDAKVDEDENGNPILDPNLIRTESAYDLAMLLSYARGMGEKWSAGVNLKLIHQSLVGEGSSFGVGADLGLLYRPRPGLGFGLRLADITTTQLYWDTGRRETVAPTLTLGASATRDLPALQGSLTLALDAAFEFQDIPSQVDAKGNKPFLQFTSSNLSGWLLPGAEYWFRHTVALRAGADEGHFTAGAGVRYKQLGADYAYLSHDELGGTHRISALVRF